MRARISDRLRLRLSKKYLDWAETLPQFGGGPIASLQRIRERQRKEAKDTHERTRPPDGTKLSLLYLRLFEMFQIEEFSSFQASLLHFFPEIIDSTYKMESLREFPNGDNVRWMSVGIITQGIGTILSADTHRKDDSLPNKVSSIHIGLYKILPSIFVPTFDVHLTESARMEIERIQRRYHMSDILLYDLLPRAKYGLIPHSSTGSEAVMMREISDWLADLRYQCERYLQPLLGGFFSSSLRDTGGKLPAIETYAIHGTPEDEEAFTNWEEQARLWHRSFGFAHYFGRYKTDKCIFELPDRYERTSKMLPVARFIALSDAYLRDNPKINLPYHTKYMVKDVLPFIVIQSFLSTTMDSLTELRSLIFSHISARSSLKQSIKLNERLSRESTLIKIIAQEFETWKDRFGKRGSDELVQFKRKPFKKEDGEEIHLIPDLISSLDYSLDRTQQLVSNFEALFANHLNLRNMEAIYKLQRTAAVASTIAVIVSVIAILISSWNSIEGTIQSLLN